VFIPADKTLAFAIDKPLFEQIDINTYLMCKTLQTLQLNDSASVMAANDVKLQAFNLKDGKFTGDGKCFPNPLT
jgi:hypothetical protein